MANDDKPEKCPTCGTALTEHPANRCLDAWAYIAKGGKVWHDNIGPTEPGFRPIVAETRNAPYPRRVSWYSTDISDAMGLLDFDSIGKGTFISLLRGDGCDPRPQWQCTIVESTAEFSMADGETAAEAITKAFIKYKYKESQDE